ncbi:MAG: restriction endonuclease subunit S [Gemmatimonadota bacterium]|nr:restriction endonuclease subunit S [Gemmatimonadota bacterium]
MTVKNGQLPKGWREVRLGEISKFSKGSGITKSEVRDTGVPCIRYGELYTKHNLKVRNFYSFISNKDLDKRKLIKNNDLLFAGSGETKEEIGKCASFNHDIRAYAGGDVIICSLDPKAVRADFASCYLNTIGRKQINRLGQGNSIVHIYSRYLENVVIPLPSIEEQKAIASLLEKWDTAIEKIEALIEAKEKQFKWLLKTLISDQQDNPEWQKMKLGEICTFEYGKPLKEQDRIGDQYPVFGSNGIVGHHNEYLVAGPFIVVGRKGSAGTVSYSMSNGFPIDTTFYVNLQSGEIHLRLLYYLLLLVQLDKISAQSGVPGLNRNDAYKISISIPSPIEQREITRALDLASRETDLLNQLAEQYRIQKHGLMQKLLTGKWRIKPNTKARM